MDQLYPKKSVYIKVDKVPPEKNGSEKKLLTIEVPLRKILNIFEKKTQIEVHDTNRYPLVNVYSLRTGKSPCLIGKSTNYFYGHFQLLCECLPEGILITLFLGSLHT